MARWPWHLAILPAFHALIDVPGRPGSREIPPGGMQRLNVDLFGTYP